MPHRDPSRQALRIERWLMVAMVCAALAALMAAVANGDAARLGAVTLAVTAAACILLAWRSIRRQRGEMPPAKTDSDARADRAESALRQLREALDELPSGLEIYDSDDRLMLFNKRLAEIYPWINLDAKVGHTFESIMRDSIGQGKIGPAIGREEEWLAQRLATRATREGPLLQSLKTGQWINTYERRTPSNLIVGVRLEVTDLVQKTRELENSQARLQAIISSAAAAIISTDRLGVVVEINAAASDLFGYQACEIVGQPLSMLIPALGAPSQQAGADAAQSVQPVRDVDIQGRAKDGNPLLLHLSMSEIHTAVGHQFVAIITDLTERKQAEEARLKAERLEAENRQIQEASRLKSQFLANMSHELRTPLNAIIGFADLLQSGAVKPDSPKHPVFLGHIASSGRHLLQLINDVLDLSKVESGKFEFFPEPIRLPMIVKEVCDILHTGVDRKKIRIEVDIDAQLSDLVLDPARLKQVLYNFLSNAIKFTPERGRVAVRARAQTAGLFRLEVEDTGIGIAPDDLPRLFSEYRQLDSGYSKQHQGTGLGLALTRRLVEAQGGTVGVRSELGMGSVFHAVLPRVHRVDANPIGDGALPSTTDRAHRLLVVEDDPQVQDGMLRSLSAAGFQVDGAATAAQALHHVRGTGFDALTLDLELPDQDGLGLLAEIRSAGPSRNSPVVGMTVAAGAGAAVSFAIADILRKPLHSEEVVAALARVREPPSGQFNVMVIDDDPLALDLMHATLTGIGVDALCIPDGRRALREIEQHRPQAIILDLMMPEFDGFAVLDALQRMPAWRDTPVFIWTSMTLTEGEYASLTRSARAVLSKGGGAQSAMLEQLGKWRSGQLARTAET
jgi:PAS domain S-box-containing protein